MKLVHSIWTELVGLFVDDGNLAVHILILVLAVAALVKGASLAPLIGAGLLLVGCLVILGLSLLRQSNAKR